MPQFDIASSYPQITFLAGIFPMFHVFLAKNTLPILSQNSKLNKRLAEIYNIFATKGLRDISLLSQIYKPSKIVSHLVHKEILCLVCLNRFPKITTLPYIPPSNWLAKANERDSKVGFLKLNKVYLSTLSDISAK